MHSWKILTLNLSAWLPNVCICLLQWSQSMSFSLPLAVPIKMQTPLGRCLTLIFQTEYMNDKYMQLFTYEIYINSCFDRSVSSSIPNELGLWALSIRINATPLEDAYFFHKVGVWILDLCNSCLLKWSLFIHVLIDPCLLHFLMYWALSIQIHTLTFGRRVLLPHSRSMNTRSMQQLFTKIISIH